MPIRIPIGAPGAAERAATNLSVLKEKIDAAGKFSDEIVGEQILAARNPALYRFYDAQRRMGIPVEPSAYYRGIRQGKSKEPFVETRLDRFVSEAARGAIGPGSRVGMGVGAALGSVVPGAGSVLGGAAGGGLAAGGLRTVANIAAPSTAGRSPVLDAASAAGGSIASKSITGLAARTRAGQALGRLLLRKPRAKSFTASDPSSRRMQDLQRELDKVMPPKREPIAQTTDAFRSMPDELVIKDGVLTPALLKRSVSTGPQTMTPAQLREFVNTLGAQ